MTMIGKGKRQLNVVVREEKIKQIKEIADSIGIPYTRLVDVALDGIIKHFIEGREQYENDIISLVEYCKKQGVKVRL